MLIVIRGGVIMRALYPEELSKESFRRFGEYEDLLTTWQNYSEKEEETGFFPDVIRFSNDGKDVSASMTRVAGLDRTIRSYEIHNYVCEGILPLDGDVYIYAAPPFWYPQLDKMRVFRIPRGTLVRLKAGTVHGTQYSVSGEPVNVLILLPERTASNDCDFTDLEEKDWMKIEDDLHPDQ